MRMNGRYEGSPTLDESPNEQDDMLEAENESLRERVSDLEKKVLDQGDEIVCLRSTLADVLRRLSQVEGHPRSSAPHTPAKSPVRPTGIPPPGINHNHNNYVNSYGVNKDGYRLRTSVTDGRDLTPVRRVHSSSLPQRRGGGVHYQSTGSLQSDSPSSSSVSPPPTPSPTRQSDVPSGLVTAKRWSSTGDFNHMPPSPSHLPHHKLSAKSLLNLNMRGNSMQNHHQSSPLRHGTREATWNEEEGTLRMYLRGRPIVLHAPTEIAQGYDITKVATPPQSKLKLDWVYGYRGKDCRSNLYLLPTGEMVYFVASVVVLYNVEEQNQRHYIGHTDDVKCLAVHPNKLVVASGQTAGHDSKEGKPHIRVWNTVSLSTLAVIGLGEMHRSISCLSFSKTDSGALLCAVDEANDHNISVWDWQKGERGYKITETKCSVDTVVAAEWHPVERACIVTCGKGHISFWSMDGAGALYKRMGVFANRDKPKYVTCIAFTHTGDVLSGDSNGNIVIWPRGTNTIGRLISKVHEGPIFSLCVLKDGSIVSGGGKDGVIKLLDTSLQLTGFETQMAEHVGGVRVVSEGRGSQLLIGSTKNCILAGSFELGFSPVVLGHTEELWALAPHPSLPQFVTAAWDSIVQLWDATARSVVWSKDIAEQAQCATFSPDGSMLVIGCTSGKWLLMEASSREIIWSHTDGSEPIQVASYSPNGEMIALGSRDNNIYVYQGSEDHRKFSRLGRCTSEKRRRKVTPSLLSILGHSSFITHLDWSVDSQYLRSNSGDYELLYWYGGLCKQITQTSSVRDVEWASHNCTLSFTSLGAWPEGADGTDVNAMAISHNNPKLLVTADDFGKVRLYSYPAVQPRSLCHTYGAHSSHVTNVAFLHQDSRLISIGGKDTAVIQWRIV